MFQHFPLSKDQIELDQFNFKEIANKIATHINEQSKNDMPYAISIYGKWGSGKSSMLNFVERFLNEENNFVILRFNPWLNNDKEELLISLAEEMLTKIENENVRNIFVKYINKICSNKVLGNFMKLGVALSSIKSGINPGLVTPLANAAGDASESILQTFRNDSKFDSLSMIKRELENALKKYFEKNNKKIIIFIDEIDRLFPDEIATIFRIIRSVLELPGVLFVVAMEKDVVCRALKDGVKIEEPEWYLHKIFQKRYYINSSYQLHTMCEKILLDNLSDLNNEQTKGLIECITVFLLDRFVDDPEYPLYLDYPNYFLNIRDIRHNFETDDVTELTASYEKIRKVLRTELSNPRIFIQFSSFVQEQWESYFCKIEEISSEHDNLYSYTLQTGFLIMILSFFAPESIKAIEGFFEKSDENQLKPLSEAIIDHLILTLPGENKENVNSSYIDSFLNSLTMLPDHNHHSTYCD